MLLRYHFFAITDIRCLLEKAIRSLFGKQAVIFRYENTVAKKCYRLDSWHYHDTETPNEFRPVWLCNY